MTNEFPSRSCQRRFCPWEGPFTDQPIIVRKGDKRPRLVGWCDICAIRICSKCAIPSTVHSAQDSFQLACLYCGERLGIGEDSLVAPETSWTSDDIQSNRRISVQALIELCKILAKRGALPTSGFTAARRAILADDPNRALKLLHAEHELCMTAGHTYGAVCCQIEEGLVLVAEDPNSQRGLSLMRKVENEVPNLHSQGLKLRFFVGYVSALRNTTAAAEEKLRAASALDQIATELGIEEGVSFAIDEIVKAQLEMRDVSAAIKTIRRLPNGEELLVKMGLSETYTNDWIN